MSELSLSTSLAFAVVRSIAIIATCFVLLCRYMVGDTNIELVFKVLGLVLFSLTVIEYTLEKQKNITLAMSMGLLSWIFLALIGFLQITFLTYIIGFIGVIGMAYNFSLIYRDCKQDSKKKYFTYITLCLLLLLVIGFALDSLQAIYGENVVTLFFTEEFINGNIHIDSIFHTAVIHSTQTYTIPSIGLDGAVYMRYHNLTNIFYTYWGMLIGTKPYQSYSYLHSIILVPFFILYFILFVIQCSHFFYKKVDIVTLLLVFFITNIGLLPTEVNLKLKTGLFDMPIQSPSLALGGIFLFLFFSFLLRTIETNKVNWIAYLLIPILGMYAKGTLLFALAPILSIYFILTKNIKGFLFSVLINAVCLICYYLFYHNPNLSSPIHLFGYLKYISDKGFYLYNFILIHISVFVSIYFLLRYKEDAQSIIKSKEINILIILLIALSLISYLVISVFDFGHNSGAFIQSARWIGLALLIALVSHEIDIYLEKNKLFFLSSKNYVFLIVLFYLITNCFFTIGRHGYVLLQETKNKQLIFEANKTTTDSLVNQRKELLVVLEKLSNIENKDDYLIFIPHQDNYLEQLFPTMYDKKRMMLVPALTGIALLDGIEQAYFNKSDGLYGFADYIYQKGSTETYKYPTLEDLPSSAKGKKIIVFQPRQLNYYIKK